MCCWHGCTCHDNEYDSSTEPTGVLGVNRKVKLYEKVMAMLGCTQCSSWKTRCEVFDVPIWCLVFDVSIRRCAGRKGNQCSFSSCISQVSRSLRTTPFMSFNHKKVQEGLGASISCTDDRMSGLPLVFKMPRLLRLLAHRKYWKSSQWHNWLLHFSPLCYLEYFHSHTIVAGWNSHAWCISFLQTVCLLIFWSQHRSTFFFLFLNEYEALYGKEKVTFKPILSCISLDCVREWDLLLNFSAYPYQNMDDHLVWLVSITRHTEQKIVTKFFIFLPMPKLYETRVISSLPVGVGWAYTVQLCQNTHSLARDGGQDCRMNTRRLLWLVSPLVLMNWENPIGFIPMFRLSDEPVFEQVTSIVHAPCKNHVEGLQFQWQCFFKRKLNDKDKVIKHEISHTIRSIYLAEPISTFMQTVSPLESSYVVEVE